MKYIYALTICLLIYSCKKEENSSNISVEGYWKVQDPTYAFNSARDLYHLFKGPVAFYRYSFLKVQDFSNLTSKPQSDSLVALYKIQGKQLMLPNPTPSAANVVPGNNLVAKSEDEMIFTRFVVLTRDLTGQVTSSRTDTIKYTRVTEAAKIAYFNNYLKSYHK